MHIRRPSRPRQAPDNPAARQGNTVPAQGEKQQRAPRAPHERDESADQQAGAAEVSSRRMAERGGNDIERGLVDTDKGQAMQETYENVRKGTPDPDKKARR
jgi:hypothetical protein